MHRERSRIRVLIVDDEPLARRSIRLLLAGDPEVEVQGECRNGFEAIAAIQKQAPDLLFLDVQMPELSGFDVLKAVGPDCARALIFVTAYQQYAIKAFEVHALDYLLKPFDDERFERALRKAKERLRHEELSELSRRLLAFMDSGCGPGPDPPSRYLTRIAVKSAGKTVLVDVDEIDWIESANQYVVLHSGADSHLLRESISKLEVQLDPRRFCRIHRSASVNLRCVREIRNNMYGDCHVLLRDGTKLKASRSRRPALEDALTRSMRRA